jgi:type II secretory pathway component GspD/PulD (secretin)
VKTSRIFLCFLWVFFACSERERPVKGSSFPKAETHVENAIELSSSKNDQIAFEESKPEALIRNYEKKKIDYFKDNGQWKIVDVPKRKKRFEEEPDPPKMKTLFYHCRYIAASQVRSIVENFLSPDGLVSISDTLNIVIVSDVEERIPTFQKYIETLDRAVPQILVNIKVIEINYDNDFEYEINNSFSRSDTGGASFLRGVLADLTAPGGTGLSEQVGFTMRPYSWNRHGNRVDQLETTLRFLVSKGRARILSAPNIIVSQGITAKIDTGEKVPVASSETTGQTIKTTFEYQSVGISLEVTPEQIEKDVVRLNILPSVRSITRTISSTDGASAPVIANRSIRTSLRVNNGEVISIGGLLKVEKKEEEKKVPFFGDIPLIGYLFKSIRQQDVRTQLVFFLQAWVLDPEQPGVTRIFVPSEDPSIDKYLDNFQSEYNRQRKQKIEKDLRKPASKK